VISLSFYIATGLERAADADRVAAALTARGWKQTYRWAAHGSVQAEGPARIAEVAAAERAGVLAADVVIVLLPGGNGTHWEAGLADGAGIPIVLCGTTEQRMRNGRECAFYYGPNVTRVEHEEDIAESVWSATGRRCLGAGCHNRAHSGDYFCGTACFPF
jgi:nucleoside 2-deoxyribosyltransferase